MERRGPENSVNEPRIGIDLGGTKIEGLRLDSNGTEDARLRIPTPRDSYEQTLNAIRDLVAKLENGGPPARIGIGIPGSISPTTGLVRNANSTWLNGQALDRDLSQLLSRPINVANDANCFALSEAVDGAGQDANVVLGIILGTGCGAGIVINKSVLPGKNQIAGEWGHTPLPWLRETDQPALTCWCGRTNCLETWISGPGMAADHHRQTGETLSALNIHQKANDGDAGAKASLARHADRVARGLAAVTNILDPDVIVIGGGLSQMPHLATDVTDLMRPYVFSDATQIDIRPPKWGDSSGVRGAAWL